MCGSVSRLASEDRLNLPMSVAALVTAAELSASSRGFMASGDGPSCEGFSATTVGGLGHCSESDSALVGRQKR